MQLTDLTVRTRSHSLLEYRLTEMQNALSYMIANTLSSSFDVCIFEFSLNVVLLESAIQISKVHLTDSGKVLVVDLEPCAEMLKKSKNDMPYWRRWTEVCIEVCQVVRLVCCVLIYMPSCYRVTQHTSQTQQLQITLVSLP
jgi:hypothetical protein